jgi:hypothetical protein
VRPLRLSAVALLAVLTACPLSACSTDVAFRTDRRVSFTSPQDRATVTFPVTLTWKVQDFTVTGPGAAPPSKGSGYFAVFIDQAPVPPGEPLSYVARQDKTCRPTDGCPDKAYLAARGIYPTTETRLVLDQLPRQADDKRRERHHAVVVLLDSSGRRIGESAFEIAFDVKRSGT